MRSANPDCRNRRESDEHDRPEHARDRGGPEALYREKGDDDREGDGITRSLMEEEIVSVPSTSESTEIAVHGVPGAARPDRPARVALVQHR